MVACPGPHYHHTRPHPPSGCVVPPAHGTAVSAQQLLCTRQMALSQASSSPKPEEGEEEEEEEEGEEEDGVQEDREDERK